MIALSRSLPIRRVLLAEVRELDEPYWCGAPGQQMTCRQLVDHARLIEQCDLEHPVILSSDGRVMDGMHRICKALLEGRDAVDAVQFLKDPEPDHRGISPDQLPYED